VIAAEVSPQPRPDTAAGKTVPVAVVIAAEVDRQPHPDIARGRIEINQVVVLIAAEAAREKLMA